MRERDSGTLKQATTSMDGCWPLSALRVSHLRQAISLVSTAKERLPLDEGKGPPKQSPRLGSSPLTHFLGSD